MSNATKKCKLLGKQSQRHCDCTPMLLLGFSYNAIILYILYYITYYLILCILPLGV